MTVLHLTGPVVVGDHDVRPEAWVLGDRITYEKPTFSDDVTTIDGWVLPGLVDMHCHVGIGPSGAVDLEIARKQAVVERDAGVLLMRDAGSPIDTSSLVGQKGLPRLIRAGRFIARPMRYLKGYAVEIEPEQLTDEVARQASAGGGWVKLIADWIDRDLGEHADLAPLWTPEGLAQAIGVAHSKGARVTAHAFAEESVTPLLDAGIDCIEHGTGMTPEHASRAALAGVPVVPTLLQVAHFASFAQQGARFPLYAERMRRMYERRHEHVRDLFDAGVSLLTGTDAGTAISHGDLAREAAEMAVSLPAADVVAGATWRARRFLGAPVLGEGEPADLVVFAEDPREDIRALASPLAVVLDGTRYA